MRFVTIMNRIFLWLIHLFATIFFIHVLLKLISIKGGHSMSDEHQSITRTMRNNRRKTKKQGGKIDKANHILNLLIALVSVLIIVSLVIILTNDKLQNNIAKSDEDSNEGTSETVTKGEEVTPNNSQDASEQVQGDTETSNTENSVENGEEAVQVKILTSADPNVIQAWEDPSWTPYATAQTGKHYNSFDASNIDYKEKMDLISRDTGLKDPSDILWSIKNDNGGAVAVISPKDQSVIYRLTMKWIDGEGWKTTLMEKLYSLNGAY